MDASRRLDPGCDTAGSAPTPPAARSLAHVALAAFVLASTALASCGTNVDSKLPDLVAKTSPPPAGSPKTLSNAEQKQAIDAMIAKRDAVGAAK